jgi:hypothetical protein
MSALDLLGPYKWVVIAVAVASALAGVWALEAHVEGIGYDKAAHVYQASIDKQKAEAAATLASETARVRAAEVALQDFKNQQEIQDANHKKTVADLSDSLRRAAGPAGRLRDPYATGCGGGGGGATGQAATSSVDSADYGAERGGLLSAELSGFLESKLQEADTINIAYASCRADATAVREP